MSSEQIPFGEQFGDIPNRKPWPDTVKAIAQAGYEAYQAGRSARLWESLNPHEQHRWLMTADFILAYPGQAVAAGIRAVYQTGMATQPWAELGRGYQGRWHAVTIVMTRTRLEVAGVSPPAPARTIKVPTPMPAPGASMRDRLIARREVRHA